ncbi:MAG: phosphomannomutase/phosphoglucomutase, partial [Gammaproteobacteria bacterium]|nr:phosphomannomutase/phosphoglucomutase [Gammaproteobacteria bacterium]
FDTVTREPGKRYPLEVYQFGTPQAHLNVVRAVTAGEGETAETRGLLVVSYDSALPRQALRSASGIAGYAELVQIAGGKQLVLAALGNQGHKQGPAVASQNVPGTRWNVRYWPDPEAAGAAGMPIEQVGAVYGAALLLFIVALFMVFRWLGGVLRQDQAAVIKLVTELVERGSRVSYPVKLASFRAMVMLLSRLSPRMVAAQAQQAKAQQAQQAVPQQGGGGAQPAAAADDTGTEAGAKQRPEGQGGKKGAPLSSLFDDLDLPDLGSEGQAPAAQADVKVPGSIFRAYDIRGVVGTTLNPDIARQIGLAIGSAALDRGQETVIVGRDGRLSGPQMLGALAEGLRASGRDVINIGLVPTPVLYFATHHLGAASGVMVTGSHNPPDYNGFKVVLDGEALSGQAIQGLHQRLEAGELSQGQGGARDEKIIDDYVDRIAADAHLAQPMKVVIDCGNGAAGAVAPALYSALGCEVVELYCDVDGQFPNHHPDPSQTENLQDLIEMVKNVGADVGLAFDGDGDRLGVVDSRGRVIWPDRLMMLFARDLLTRHPEAEILFDVKCSRNLASVIKQHGGRPTMWRTGHSLIKARMRESGALLAGEMSGHFFFAERWFGFDDGLYAGARLLEILSGSDMPSSEVFDGLPDSVSTPELKITVPEGAQHGIVERLVAEGQNRFPEAEVITIDGLRVEFPEGWGLVRASNTTPNLVLRFESDSKEGLESIQERFGTLLQAVEPSLKLPF